MSGKDFAKIQANAHPKKGKKQGGSASIAPAIGIIAVAALCFVGGYWIGTNAGSPPKSMGNSVAKADYDALKAELDVKAAESRVQQARIETLQELVAEWKAKAQQDAHSKVGDLNFYQELPKQKVLPAPVEPSKPAAPGNTLEKRYTPPAPPPDAPPETVPKHLELTSEFKAGSYRVQLGSFRDSHDAQRVQQQLIHAGFPALIQLVDLGEKGSWYRVYAGPYDNRDGADNAVRDIDNKLKLKGLVIRGD